MDIKTIRKRIEHRKEETKRKAIFNISLELDKRLDSYCKDKERSRSFIVEAVLDAFLEAEGYTK